MAVDAFLKMDVKGESVVDGHEDEIQLLSWSWGMSQTGTTHRGTRAAARARWTYRISASHITSTPRRPI